MVEAPTVFPPVSILHAALTCTCPRCGRGRLFQGLLTVRDRCPACGLDLSHSDVGDSNAVIVIIILGAVIVVLALWVEFTFSPPLWVHAVLWPVVTIPAAIALMRPMKAWLVASQYRNRPNETAL